MKSKFACNISTFFTEPSSGVPAHSRLFHLPELCEDEETANLNDSGSQRAQKVAEDHSKDDFFLESLRNNTEVLATSSDWLTLAYLEPLMAKKHNARINDGERAMRTLNLF